MLLRCSFPTILWAGEAQLSSTSSVLRDFRNYSSIFKRAPRVAHVKSMCYLRRGERKAGCTHEKVYRKEVVDSYELNYHEMKMDGVMFADALPRAVKHMEGPVPHGGCVLLMLLCDYIKQDSKVVLTGEGADEFFGGYERYSLWNKNMWQERFSRWLPHMLMPNITPFKTIKKISGKDAVVKSSVYGDTSVLFDVFPGLMQDGGYREAVSGKFSDFRTRMFAVDQTSYLQSLLVRQDKMAMAASVEARVPFVHLPLVEFVNNIPNKLRAPGGITKPILKKITEKYLPADFVNRRKIGLILPYDKWCDDPMALGRYLDFNRSRFSIIMFFRR